MTIFTWHDGEVLPEVDTKQVYGLLFTHDGRLLLKTESNNNLTDYSLPGGRPEKFDNGIESTLQREVLEEVNITIKKPILIGYQLVDEQNGSAPFAQVRMTAIIDTIGTIKPDPDNGRTYGRLLVNPLKAAELLNWGYVGLSQIKSAILIANQLFDINEFSSYEEFV